MAPNEARRDVPQGRQAGFDRLAGQITLDVCGKGFDGRVALHRFQRQRLGEDRIQVTAQHAGAIRCSHLARERQVPVQHRLFEADDRPALRVVGALAREQFEQYDRERVDVGRNGNGRAQELLGCCVSWCQRPLVDLRDIRLIDVRCLGILAQEPGDAEIEQPHFALVRDQDVARLEIAMNDQARVGERHGAHHLQKQLQTRPCVEVASCAVLLGRFTPHVLQCHERLSGSIHADVVQARDVGMLQARQDVALARGATAKALVDGRAMRQFQRDLALDCAIGALRQPHCRHAARADLLQQPIRSDEISRSVDGIAGSLGRVGELAQHIAGLESQLVREQDVTQRIAQVVMRRRELIEPLLALLDGLLHGLIEQAAQALPIRRGEFHRNMAPSNSLAFSQSRRTVLTAMPSASLISASDMPAK